MTFDPLRDPNAGRIGRLHACPVQHLATCDLILERDPIGNLTLSPNLLLMHDPKQGQSIGTFLLRRLQEVGIRHIFGVPGDYSLELMQQLEDRGEPAWIGNCNELNASYATDAYARINGIGALSVTHGVGALSAINGIAGAYSEHVPVI